VTDLQRFKDNDITEAKVIEVAMPTLELIGSNLDDFWQGAFTSYLLGEVLYDLDRDPMSGVISRTIFRQIFPEIHQIFTRPGTFEFYLTIFRAIWGEDVEIEFVVPDEGRLQINASNLPIEEFNLLLREIVSDEYVYSELVDHAGDFIMLQDKAGIKNQSELDALINEISPAGIFTETTLTL
jgi:hypothetical protein